MKDLELQDYFDFKRLFKTVLESTLLYSPTKEDYIENYYVTGEEELKGVSDLYFFISNSKLTKSLLTEFEVSEEQTIDFSSNEIGISFDEDTSTHTENGSDFGGYQYIFTIDIEEQLFINLKVINHN